MPERGPGRSLFAKIDTNFLDGRAKLEARLQSPGGVGVPLKHNSERCVLWRKETV